MTRPGRSARTASSPDVSLATLVIPWKRLLPMWRVAVFSTVVLGLAMTNLAVRLSTIQLRKDIQTVEARQMAAEQVRARLELDRASRHAAVPLESVAAALGLGPTHTVKISLGGVE